MNAHSSLKGSPTTNYLLGQTASGGGGAIGGGGAGAVGGGELGGGGAAVGGGAAGAAAGTVAVLVIVYAGHDIITYKPCQPLGWGNVLTWVGDQLADEIYGNPCGCPKATDPLEDSCEAKFDAWTRKYCDPLQKEDPQKYLDCFKQAYKAYQDCKAKEMGVPF